VLKDFIDQKGLQNDIYMLWNKRQVIYKQLDYKDLKMEGFNSMTSQILVGDSNH